jgi:putative peptide zinc metalloprotease protein
MSRTRAHTLPAQLDALPLPAHDGSTRRKATRSAPSRHAPLDVMDALDATPGAATDRHAGASRRANADTVSASLLDAMRDMARDAPCDVPRVTPQPDDAVASRQTQAYTRQLIDELKTGFGSSRSGAVLEPTARPSRPAGPAVTADPPVPTAPAEAAPGVATHAMQATSAAPATPATPAMAATPTAAATTGTAASPAITRRPRWPVLRDELQLHHGPALHDGEPSWTLQDPVRHRFLRIDWLSYEVLRRWWLGDADRIADQINHQTTLAIDSDHVLQVLAWATREQLVLPLEPHPVAPGTRQDDSQLGALARWLLHHYLFFRVPLFNPDRLLARLLPWLAPLGARPFGWLTVVVGCVGAAGVLRELGTGGQALQAQWLDLLSWQGLALYGLTLAVVKVAHEFGHALVAKHYGLNVPTMGAAFMVMWPVAYTDTSEAWRLSDARARLRIAAAGVRTELTLAAWSTLAWVLLPDGPARTAAFIVATMTWLSSIAINASPFMRFDGYYLLCDWLDLPNLHERSFALARWQLRRGLLGWQADDPEHLGTRLKRWLVAFAVATWAYRLTLYLGIAWMVYHYGFPALGLLLFAVELGWFIAAPVKRELALWIKGYSRWRAARRWRWSALALAGAAGLAAWPWPVRESAGAVLQPVQELALRVPASVTLRQLKVELGQHVGAGSALLQAEVPALAHKSEAAQVRIRQLEQQVAIASLNGEQKAEWRSLQAALDGARREAGALRQELARFQPVAPFDAVVVELDTSLAPGSTLSPQQTVLRLASTGPGQVLAWVSDYAAARIQPGDAARFSADALPLQRLAAHVVSVSPHPSAVLDEPMLARQHGGPVEAHEASGRWSPTTPLYRVELALDDDPGLTPRHWRGHVVITLPGRSGWDRAWSATSEVLAREVGF